MCLTNKCVNKVEVRTQNSCDLNLMIYILRRLVVKIYQILFLIII